MRRGGRPARLLLVEDSVADAKLVALALEESGSTTQVTRVEDGVAALELLDRVLTGEALRPDLVVLDLNLPRVGGLDVLRRIKSDPDLRTVPVVVFSTSRAEVDVAAAYACGASSYVVKPLDLHRFTEVVTSIEQYWTAVVRLP
ncbi:MAG TPA: response regulator [Actinomycetes bacterium]|nr:response regulator [Actinomycetes bacterium]